MPGSLGLGLRVQEMLEVSASREGLLWKTGEAERGGGRGRAELAQGDFPEHPRGNISGAGLD